MESQGGEVSSRKGTVMSFGLRDKDWVEPQDSIDPECPCSICVSFNTCPCGCGEGWCETFHEYVDGDEFADCGRGYFVL